MVVLILITDTKVKTQTQHATAVPNPSARTCGTYKRLKRIERTCEGCGATFMGDASIAHWQRFCPTKCQPQRKREFTRERQRRYRSAHKAAR